MRIMVECGNVLEVWDLVTPMLVVVTRISINTFVQPLLLLLHFSHEKGKTKKAVVAFEAMTHNRDSDSIEK